MTQQKGFSLAHFISILLFLSVIGNGYFFYLYHTVNKKYSATKIYEQFPLLAKRIFVEDPNDTIINFVPLRQALRDYVSEQGGKIGVYFEYLSSGVSIGANEKTSIPVASLSKVPIVMSIFKKQERGKISLTNSVAITKDDLDNKFGTLWQQGEGATFTIEEYIKFALLESDNTAYNVLFRQLSGNEVNEVYDNLDIEIVTEKNTPEVSPKSYSSVLRSLFLSSFLSEEDSSYILDLLTKTKFNDQLPAGVPTNILVAHKVGVLQRTEQSQNVFIDCGIVYVPNRPYLLCIFSQTSDPALASKQISYISKMVYQYITIVPGGKEH